MKVLVAAIDSRRGGFSHVRPGELVGTSKNVCGSGARGICGCERSFIGRKERKACSAAQVIEVDVGVIKEALEAGDETLAIKEAGILYDGNLDSLEEAVTMLSGRIATGKLRAEELNSNSSEYDIAEALEAGDVIGVNPVASNRSTLVFLENIRDDLQPHLDTIPTPEGEGARFSVWNTETAEDKIHVPTAALKSLLSVLPGLVELHDALETAAHFYWRNEEKIADLNAAMTRFNGLVYASKRTQGNTRQLTGSDGMEYTP